MVPRTKIDSLRDAAVGADCDQGKVIDPHPFPNPGLIADRQLPWILDIDTRFYDHTITNLCSKEAEHDPFYRIEGKQPGVKEESIDKVPGKKFS